MPTRILSVFFLVQLCGCSAVGPPTVDRDRFDYIEAISASWKRQTLLNLVKVRHLDAPVFMDVSSVISQYALESEIQLGLTWSEGNTQNLSGKGKYTDRPTITYSPVIGRNYAQKLLAPLPLPAILLLLQAGYPASHVLSICVQDINGLNNGRNGVFDARPAEPEYFELLNRLRVLQETDGMAMRSRRVDDKEVIVIIFKTPKNETAASALKRVRALLGLDRDSMEFPVVYGGNAVNDREIAIQGRSMLQIMTEFGAGIDIPDLEVAEGYVPVAETWHGEHNPAMFRVRSGTAKPDETFVAVFYRDHWFWIEDRDTQSKVMFRFLMILFSFSERGETGQAAPVVTVPTN